MMRSMFSGVSGLKGHQTRMDVIGNNIANVNTTGFKASRVTFADMISQNLSGASSPTGNSGGVNPKQIGLGMAVASTDLIYTNGSVQQTGKNTDVAISRGDGLFVVKRGNQQFYTRNGAFNFDADGNLTIPSTGLYVQGYMANKGEINVAGDNTTNIQIPAGKSMEATKTDLATYTKNLNASSPGYEIANTLVRYADGTTASTNNYSPTEAGRITLTLNTGDKIYMSHNQTPQAIGSAPSGLLYTSKVTSVTAMGTSAPVNATLSTDPDDPSSPLSVNGGTTLAAGALSSGTYAWGDKYTIRGTISAATTIANTNNVSLTIHNTNISGMTTMTVVVPRPTNFTYKIGDTYTGQMKLTNLIAAPGAIVSTQDGNRLPLTSALTINSANTSYTRNGSGGTITAITREAVYQHDGKTVSSVAVNTKSGVLMEALVGKSYAAGDAFYPSVTTTITVYDSLGAAHSVPVVFTKTANNRWQLSLGNGSDTFTITEKDNTTTKISLTKTNLEFDTKGAYVSGTASLKLKYENGAAEQEVALNLAAITQYSGTSTISGTSNGNAAGTLASVDIDSSGVITGTYTNGVRQKEAQIAMAQFNNPSGLTKMGGNLYQESNNTGTRTISGASDIGTELTTSALEMSNVDIADQFSDMIITQRGFQSNSKIITVSDEMLETLINMKR